MPFWQFFRQGWDGRALLFSAALKHPSQDFKRKKKSQKSADEFLAILEGKIRVTPFFKVQSSKITVCILKQIEISSFLTDLLSIPLDKLLSFRHCRKCDQRGHTKTGCMLGMEDMPLPDEVLLKIFKHLNYYDLIQCAQTSLRMQKIILGEKLIHPSHLVKVTTACWGKF